MKRRRVPNRVRFLVMKMCGYRCQLCGRTANQGVQLDIDHKVAVARGGTNDLENLWVLCSPCNNGKGSAELDGCSCGGHDEEHPWCRTFDD